MPPFTASLPSLRSAAAFVLENTTDTSPSSNISTPMNCTDPENRLGYASIECKKSRRHKILVNLICICVVFTTMTVGFCFAWRWMMKRAQKLSLRSNVNLREDEIMDGGDDAPPSYSMDMRTAEEASPSPPAYTPVLEGPPSYTLVGQAIDPVTLQPVNPPPAPVINPPPASVINPPPAPVINPRRAAGINGIIYDYPEFEEDRVNGFVWY